MQELLTIKAGGYLPYAKELAAIKAGVGGARPTDTPLVRNVGGLGNVVINSGEKVVSDFLGSGKAAILTRDMQQQFSKGLIPNFADTIPIFGDAFKKKLLAARNSASGVHVSADLGAAAREYKDEGYLIPSLLYKAQGALNKKLLQRGGYKGFEDADYLDSITKNGTKRSEGFLFAADANGGRAFARDRFKPGNFLAPEAKVGDKLREAQLSKYLPSSERLSDTVSRSGQSFEDAFAGFLMTNVF